MGRGRGVGRKDPKVRDVSSVLGNGVRDKSSTSTVKFFRSTPRSGPVQPPDVVVDTRPSPSSVVSKTGTYSEDFTGSSSFQGRKGSVPTSFPRKESRVTLRGRWSFLPYRYTVPDCLPWITGPGGSLGSSRGFSTDEWKTLRTRTSTRRRGAHEVVIETGASLLPRVPETL